MRTRKARSAVLVGVSLVATIAAGALLLRWLAQQDLIRIAVAAAAAFALMVVGSPERDQTATSTPQPCSVCGRRAADPADRGRRRVASLRLPRLPRGDPADAQVHAARDVVRRVDRRPLGVVLNRVRGFERRANVGAPLELASRPGGG